MIRRLTLTDEHIRLMSLIRFEEDEEEERLSIYKNNPYELAGRLQDLALVLGYMDKAIPGTEEDPEGLAFPDEVEEHLAEVHKYIADNLYLIELLIHQMAFKEPIKPGTYKYVDEDGFWTRED